MLTTSEAARVVAVTASTIKRWADQGVLPFTRTAGGHRRFERAAVDRLAAAQAGVEPSSWMHCLLGGRRHEVDGRLLEARARLGAWHRVADELSGVLGELGRQWERGWLTIAEEHVATETLLRALARLGDALPTRIDGPRALLAVAPGDEHTLGLAMAELCLYEQGWSPIWLGRFTPIDEVLKLVSDGKLAMVVLTASAANTKLRALREIAAKVGAACSKHGIDLVLGGGGPWPARPKHGARLTSFNDFHQHLTERTEQRTHGR